MQLSELRTRVRYHLREATANTWTDVELNSHINLAQRYIGSRLRPELIPALIVLKTETIVTSILSWSLPTDYVEMVSSPYHVSAAGVYTQFPFKDTQKFAETASFGTNHLMYQKYVSAVTDGLLRISQLRIDGFLLYYYLSYPADLTIDSSVTEIPEGYVDLVILKAAADALIKTRQLDESNLLLKYLEGRIDMANKEKK